MRILATATSAALLLALNVSAQEPVKPVGIFENHMDIGNPEAPGDATYDSETGEYIVEGSEGIDYGAGNTKEHSHFVYSEVIGDFRIIAKIYAENLDGRYTAERL